jgi:starch-binding outer membrane protein, SusD/RagB family
MLLNTYISVEQNRRQYLTGAAQYQDRHQRYPIPSIQIELSSVDGEDRLVQNSGW